MTTAPHSTPHTAKPAANPAIAAAFAPVPGKSVTVTLVAPIERAGGAPITEITLNKPNAGSLRGLKVPDLVSGDVSTVLTVLPRISHPVISAQEAEQLETEDLGEIAGAIFGFFMTPTDKAKMARMMGS